MEITKNNLIVRQLGDSLYLLLDKNIKQQLDIRAGTVLSVKLQNIQIKEVKCPSCEYKFSDYVDADPHDCAKCGKEFLDINNNLEEVKSPVEDEVVNGEILKGGNEEK